MVLETLPLHHLSRVVSLLHRGAMVAYPTGTSYALGVNALNHDALKDLAALKQRPEEKTYTVLLPTRAPERFVRWTAEEQRVFAALRNRPLTLLVRAADPLAHLARDGRVGIRTPDHPFTRELVDLLPFPVTATSANVSDRTPAFSLQDLEPLAKDVRLYTVETGTLPRSLPSTIAARTTDGWEIVRAGDVTERELTDALKSP